LKKRGKMTIRWIEGEERGWREDKEDDGEKLF